MHHGQDLPDYLAKEAHRFRLGATGERPGGRLDDTDQGEIKFGVAYSPTTQRIILNFGKPVAWIGATLEQAEDLANHLLGKVREAKYGPVMGSKQKEF